MPSQLDLLPPGQASLLLSKKRFWKKTMWISLAVAIGLLLLGIGGQLISMTRAFARLEETGAADPAALANEISSALIFTVIVLPFSALAFVIFLTSLIRCLSLPKLPASPPRK